MEERRLRVLRAIVEDFVATNEPVGSKALVERHQLGVSPATVRNDMATLEEEGYIAQPHTSAGRVPTEKGYRLFVDRISEVKPLSPAERRAIEAFLAGAVDLDDVVRRTVRLLAQVTRQVAVVQYPVLSRSSVRHVELVPLSPGRLVLVAITDTGRVEQRTLDVPVAAGEDQVADLRARLNARICGRPLTDIPELVTTLPEEVAPELRPLAVGVVSVVLESLVEQPEERVAIAGTANLTRSSSDFPLTLRPVLEALEEQVVLLRLLGETGDPSTLTVRIGPENPVEELHSASVVTTVYGSQAPLGSLGVVGPMRMDYPATMASVRAVARYVGQLLGSA